MSYSTQQNYARYWESDPARPGIFVCYRYTEPDIQAAMGIDKLLAPAYGEGNVFMSHRSVLPGEHFEPILDAAIRSSAAMLAVVGLGWAQSLNKGRHTWVLHEIAKAQSRGVPILPVYLTQTHQGDANPDPPDKQSLGRRVEFLTSENLPLGVDRGFLDAEQVIFDTSHHTEGRRIVEALGRLVPDLRPTA